jgi:hypothetical protein
MPPENDEDSNGNGSGELPPGTMAAVGELIKASADNPNIKAAGGEFDTSTSRKYETAGDGR